MKQADDHRVTVAKLSAQAKADLLDRLAHFPHLFVIDTRPPVHEVMRSCEERGVEHITHVAVYFREKAWSLPWPCRHCHVLDMLRVCDGCPYDFDRHQGFLTSTGRFVWREEAADIARAAGQTQSQRSELFSEDVW